MGFVNGYEREVALLGRGHKPLSLSSLSPAQREQRNLRIDTQTCR
jgi:hypothetical protein